MNRTVPAVIALLLTVAFAQLAFNRLDLADDSFLTSLEMQWLDARFRLRGARPGSSEIVIVGVEDKTLTQLAAGHVFQRSHFATLVRKLAEADPKAIGFAITFDNADASHPGNDHQLASAIQSAQSVVLGVGIGIEPQPGKRRLEQTLDENSSNVFIDKQIAPDAHYEPGGVTQTQKVFLGTELKGNLPELTQAAASFGFLNFHADSEGRVRYQPQVIDHAGRLYPSLDLQILRRFLDAPPILINHNREGFITGIRVGDRTMPTDQAGRLMLDFTGPRGMYQTIPMIDVVEGRAGKEVFKDKIVLVGAPTIGLKDLVVSPFDPVLPAVELHANIIDNVLHNRYLRRNGLVKAIDIATVLFFGIMLAIYWRKLDAARGLFYSSLLMIGLAAFNYWAFITLRWVLSFVYSALSLLVTTVVVISYQYLTAERARKRTKEALQHYVDSNVIERVMDKAGTLKLSGERRELTVLFSNIRGFSSFSEKMEPTDVVRFLNEYFSSMTSLIFKNRGTLDKLIGDALMCFWGHPLEIRDHALRALITALEMIHAVEDLRGVLVLPGGARFEIGIGLNTGPMVVGNMGSQSRLSYTVIGDNVNLASRLESLNKHYGTRILISDTTFQWVKDFVLCRQLDTIQVAGKSQPVAIYEPLGVRPLDWERRRTDRRGPLTRKKKLIRAIVLSIYGERRRQYRRLGSERLVVKPEHEEIATMYEHGLSLYRKSDFDGAVMVFDHVLSISPNDGPSRLMKNRIAKHRAEQTAETQFDPVFRFEDSSR
jgi:adenylate cyclase